MPHFFRFMGIWTQDCISYFSEISIEKPQWGNSKLLILSLFFRFMKKSSREGKGTGGSWVAKGRILVCQAICEKRCCCVLLRQLQLVLESSLETGSEFDEQQTYNIQSYHASLPLLLAIYSQSGISRATQDNPHPCLECSFCPLHSRYLPCMVYWKC